MLRFQILSHTRIRVQNFKISATWTMTEMLIAHSTGMQADQDVRNYSKNRKAIIINFTIFAEENTTAKTAK